MVFRIHKKAKFERFFTNLCIRLRDESHFLSQILAESPKFCLLDLLNTGRCAWFYCTYDTTPGAVLCLILGILEFVAYIRFRQVR